jgi:CHAT domain-containing protein
VTISIAPSLAALPDRRPALPEHASVLAIGAPEAQGLEFPALPFAGAELEALGGTSAPRRWFGSAAPPPAPEAYLTSRPERFSFVHFAAHAVANRPTRSTRPSSCRRASAGAASPCATCWACR